MVLMSWDVMQPPHVLVISLLAHPHSSAYHKHSSVMETMIAPRAKMNIQLPAVIRCRVVLRNFNVTTGNAYVRHSSVMAQMTVVIGLMNPSGVSRRHVTTAHNLPACMCTSASVPTSCAMVKLTAKTDLMRT
jgi:hypothetical protein